MYVCVCKAITESDVRREVNGGARTVRDLRERLGLCSACCKCAGHARSLLPRGACAAASEAPQRGFPDLLAPQPAA